MTLVDREFAAVAIERIKPSPLNPRKTFDAGKTAELAASIKAQGVLQPLVVRANGQGYEIVCGDRRWRAAKIAGLSTLPVIARTLTDAEAVEIMAIENGQREDMAPMEEAEGYARLRKTAKYSVAQIAAKIGKSESYVFHRLQLLDLDKPNE